LDHVFGNQFIAETYGLTLQIHENELPVLDYAPISGLMYNLPFDQYQGEKKLLSEGDEIVLGEDMLSVILTPGHSPGSLSFYSKAQHFVISGDALFHRSIGRTDLPGGNHETLLRSIREKLFSLPEQTKVYSGHGPITTIGEEKKENPFVGEGN
jgi:glyoxylase-like metal-dependent hydrolase (beta-lactamase superfamily II)